MSPNQSRVAWSLVLLLAVGVCIAFSYPFSAPADEEVKSPPPQTLLPKDSILYVGTDGRDAHKAEFEKTAAYEAIYKSGLADVIGKIFNYAATKAGKETGIGGFDLFKKTFGKINHKGLSFAITVSADVGPPKPWAILVLHEAGELEPDIARVIKNAAAEKLKFESKTVSGRKVTRAAIPAEGAPFELEVGWWKEGKHLVLVAGADAVGSAVKVAAGKSPNITTNRLWKTYREGKADFTVSSVAWLDVATLRKMFGKMPVPETGTPEKPATVNDILTALGVANLNAIVGRSGFRGKASWSETLVEAPGPRTGLLSLADNKPITLQDLPPMPVKTKHFFAGSVDLSKTYATILETVRKAAKLGPPGSDAKLEAALDQLPAILGFDPRKDLLDHLGNVVCAYDDPNQGLFGTGAAIVVKVKDGKALRRTLDDLLNRAVTSAPPGQFHVWRTNKHGHQIVTAEIAGGVANPSYAITGDWLCIGSIPQSVEAFLLRLNKKLPAWEPSLEHRQGLEQLPKRFTAISVSDPRDLYRLIVGLAPTAFSFAKAALSQTGVKLDDFPVALPDIPPAELVTHPLFPNITVQTSEKDVIRSQSRSSIAGFFGADTATVTAVGVALLLPAVQQAREAARRSSSKNNLKKIGLALHNYHDVHSKFPEGTHPNKKLKPAQRLSWQASILPYIEQAPLYNNIDFKKGWKDDANAKFLKTPISVYQNPQVAVKKKPEYGATHYVGIAGVGKNSLTTTKLDKKVGIFGYNRTTRIRDITDGTSNTMMVSEASKDYGPWAAGGPSTIRALTKKPYINGPDGIGGPFKGGFHVLFADGAVRFISNKIDSTVLEGLATMRGGEAIGDF